MKKTKNTYGFPCGCDKNGGYCPICHEWVAVEEYAAHNCKINLKWKVAA